jgi:RAB protein geranylgeranyltransferase component A
MVVKVPITPLEEVSYVPYIDRNSYYGGESASITPLEEVSYVLHIDRNSYYLTSSSGVIEAFSPP